MAGGTGGRKSRVKEKSRGGYRSAADGRPVAAANRPYQRPRTQPHHGRGLSQFRKETLTNPTLKAFYLFWTLERRALVLAPGSLKPVGRLSALVPLDRCV